MERSVDQKLVELLQRYGLAPSFLEKARAFLELVERNPLAATTVKKAEEAVDIHFADSLTVFEIDEFQRADTVLDMGSGAGIPVIPLGIVCPDKQFEAVESVGKKCEFIKEAASNLSLSNVSVVQARAEEYVGPEVDLVTARAVAPLGVLLEYAAPLLKRRGTFIGWKGEVDAGELEGAERAAGALNMELSRVLEVTPYEGSRSRTLHVYSKTGETPERFPRRAGVAKKRPL